jgi:hypothetical protein
MSSSFFYGKVNFGEGVRVVVQAFRAFKSGKIGADRNGGEVFGQALVIADSTFKRTIRFHSDLLFVPVMVVWCFFRPLHTRMINSAKSGLQVNQTFVSLVLIKKHPAVI